MTEHITIIVADDHPMTRVGTVQALRQIGGLKVVGEASNGLQALKMCEELRPHILLLDIRLPELEGLTVAHLLARSKRAPRIIIFSAFANDMLVQAALEAGASGYILKTTASADLSTAIRRVMGGQQVLLGVKRPQDSKYQLLSRQELLVLNYVAKGLSTKEIALQMNSSSRTIETYLNRAFCKLRVSNRTQAAIIAYRERWLPIDEDG